MTRIGFKHVIMASQGTGEQGHRNIISSHYLMKSHSSLPQTHPNTTTQSLSSTSFLRAYPPTITIPKAARKIRRRSLENVNAVGKSNVDQSALLMLDENH